MDKSYKPRGSIMPSFPLVTITEFAEKQDAKSNEIGKFIIRTYPLGFRGYLRKVPCLSKLLCLIPYVTGSEPKFKVTIKHSSTIGKVPFHVDIYENREGESAWGRPLLSDRSETGEYEGDIEAPWVSQAGEYKYSAILSSVVTAQCHCDIIVFRALAQESITLVLLNILFGLFGIGLGSLLTWLLMK